MATNYLDSGNTRTAVTDNARHVNIQSTGPTGLGHNRNIDDCVHTTHPGTDASNTATWTAAENVTELEIRAVETAAGALQTTDAFLVVTNAPTAAIAKTWLEDNTTDYAYLQLTEDITTDYTQDVMYEMGYWGETLTIHRTSAITRVDVLPISGVNMRIIIGAA